MAQIGTAVKTKEAAQFTLVVIKGLTGDGNVTPTVFTEALPYGTVQIVVTGTAITNVQLQVGNDSTAANFVALGTAIVSFPATAQLTPSDLPFLYHNWKLSGGDSTSSVTITEVLMGSRG